MSIFRRKVSEVAETAKDKLAELEAGIESETERGLRDVFDIDFEALPEVMENVVSTIEGRIEAYDTALENLRQRMEETAVARAGAVDKLAKAKQMQAVLVPAAAPAPAAAPVEVQAAE